MLRPFLLPALLCAAVPLSAQGKVNPSLVRAPADDPTAAAVRRSGISGAVAKARPAIVHVFVEVDGERGRFAIERCSSGVVVDSSGLVLTLHRLVQESVGATDKRLCVQLDDATHTQLPATVAKTDADTGLVLLRVTPPENGLAHVELGPDRPATGQPLAVLACPEGKDVLGFAGVASPALADVQLGGRRAAAKDVFLTDSKQDQRCDGGAVIDAEGRLLGLFDAERVLRDPSEPTLEDLKKPSFGVVRPAGAVRRAFAAEFAGPAAKNPGLRAAPAPSPTIAAVARVAPSVLGFFGGEGDWPVLPADDPGAVQRRAGLGSAVAVARDLAITNAHLCAGKGGRLRLPDGRTLPAAVVKRNEPANLVLLRAELPAGVELVPAPAAADDDVQLGETVYALGNPLGSAVVVTMGVVSARRGREGGRIQADPNLGNQNGGGACVDATGLLLGIADGGAIDPLEMAFAMRGDRASADTNLSTFVGIARVRSLFATELAGALPATAGDRTARTSPLVRMVEVAGPAMLNVYVARDVRRQDPDDPFAEAGKPELVTLGVGSGVIVDPSGLALSNWHVVDEATWPDGAMKKDHAVFASVFGGKTYRVRVLSISREDDLSLLQLELEPGETVRAVELGSSDGLCIGEAVAAIGNPHNRANTITFGVVTAKDQERRIRGRWAKLEHLIETDAAINGGNSGGALLDLCGRLVGINSAGGGTFTTRGYAIGVDHVRKQVLGLLLQAYKLRSPDLGLRVLDDEGRVSVLDVDGRGPAAAAGVRSGDRLVSLGGVEVTWSPGYALTLAKAKAGQPLELVVERSGAQQTFRPVPLPPEVWAVIRQSGLQCRSFGFREDPDRVRAAVVALHRRLTGDPQAEPPSIPEQVVAVERVFPEDFGKPVDVQAGDLLLAVELVQADTGNPVFVRLEDVGKLKDLWNDRNLGTYEGSQWQCWLARGTELRTVELTARRLFW